MNLPLLLLQLPLLQVRLQDFRPRESDPKLSIIFLVCFGALIIILIVISIIRNGIGATGLSGQKVRSTASSPRQFSVFKMHKAAKFYGFDKDQIKLLEYIFRNDGVSDPAAVLGNTDALDRSFKRAYKSIEKKAASEEELQNFLSVLFSIRNIVEFIQGRNSGASSTRQIPENTGAVLTSARQEKFPVKVISSQGDNLLVECPKNTLGTPIRFGSGQKIKLSFFTNSSKGFSFDTKVLGTVDTPKGLALSLAHSTQVNKSMTQRRFKRLEVSIPTFFFMVNMQDVKVGRKWQKKMVVAPQRYKGTIQNISLGGCALKTGSNIQAGTRLKITFENDDGLKIAALGLVLRTNRSGAAAMTLHIKFLKVPRRSQNAINAMVFEYDQY
jgi:c-di-GMP-binding flagellar brake protein YcgR